MKDMTVSQFQWAMSRLEGKRDMFSPELAEALKIARYLVDVIVTRAEFDCKSSAVEIIPRLESLILQGSVAEKAIP
jgi:hypothetical protein